MEAPARAPWHPDRRWADPLIALLSLLALLAAILSLGVRQQRSRRPSERASLQGRMTEVGLAGPRILTGRGPTDREWRRAEAQLKEPWDRALLAVLKAELGGPNEAKAPQSAAPAGASGDTFRRACLAAYGEGPLPSRAERDTVHRHLGGGHAAALLEARLLDREGGGETLRAQARQAILTRLLGLGLLGLLVLGLGAGGLVLGIYLLAQRKQPPARPLPQWSMSGRAAALVMLGWFLAYFLAGNLVGLLLLPWPALRWMGVPLGTLLHMGCGIGLLCRAEGLGLRGLWRRVAPGAPGRDLAWGAAFLGLAVLLVITVSLLSGLLLKPDQSPQRDLQDLLRSLAGWGPTLTLFLTVAALAPFFEELLFRGFLLPILARGRSMALALGGSALLFGAIHLQPMGLPTLSTLGFVMGLAMRHTGSLRTPILVHACWNGALFLLMRGFA